MKIFLFSIVIIITLAFCFTLIYKSPDTSISEMVCRIPETNDLTGKNEGWELMTLPENFKPSTITFGEKGEIVLIGRDIRLSKDNGKTWTIISEGKGFDRCTYDGGKTFDKDCDTASKKPGKINLDDDCLLACGDVENPVLTPDGRLYFLIVYDHHGALWSIPLEDPKDLWFGLHFTYKDKPENAEYWATGNFITLKNRVFVSADSSVNPSYNWLTTSNKGKTWYRAGFNLKSDRFFIDIDTGLRIVRNQIEKTTEGGRGWRILQSSKIPANTHSYTFVDDKTGFVADYSGMLAVTKDGGITWRNIETGTTEQLYIAAALDAKNAWVAGGVNVVFETSDGGETWQRVDLGFEKGIYSEYFGGGKLKVDKFHRTVWIVKDGKIYRKNVK